MIHSIFQHVASLEDMQFLVKYAAQVLFQYKYLTISSICARLQQVFPPSPDEANGEIIWNNILSLQRELTTKREVGFRNISLILLYYSDGVIIRAQ